MTRPRLLDLYAGAGGSAVGYARAGFDVIGVDIVEQPNYPYEFIRDDALSYLRHLRCCGPDSLEFDAIHASPPCQAYSALGTLSDNEHPDLIGPTRDLLEATGLPYVIENVPGAPLRKDYLRLAWSDDPLHRRERHRALRRRPRHRPRRQLGRSCERARQRRDRSDLHHQRLRPARHHRRHAELDFVRGGRARAHDSGVRIVRRAPRTTRPFTVWHMNARYDWWRIESTWSDRDRALLRAETLAAKPDERVMVVEEVVIFDVQPQDRMTTP